MAIFSQISAMAAVAAVFFIGNAHAEAPARTWREPVEAALKLAGANRPELTAALTKVPDDQREGMEFLIENMPPGDLRSLTAEFLLAHVKDSYAALAAAPWGKTLPKEIFLNDVLPYACLNERRDNGRPKLRELAAPLVKDCRTPAEAGQVLNQKLFSLVKVKYSTERKKPDQSALETMESGRATCSGLSILLVDACRSVAVPARVVGTPMWTNMRGNHTWVEIWDGDWHFAGAAEPDGKGLDRGWFAGDASKADDSRPEHRIYASSFRKTGIAFPLVWDLSIGWVPAENVTARYTAMAKKPESGKVKVMVRVTDNVGGAKRIPAKVTLTDKADPKATFTGVASGETADLNNILTFQLPPGHTYTVEMEWDGKKSDLHPEIKTTDKAEQLNALAFFNVE